MPLATALATETEPQTLIRSHRRRTPARLPRVIRSMQHCSAMNTALSPYSRRQLFINSLQQPKKLGVFQQGVAHFARLEA
jgi:hypothetical protein